MKDYEPGFVHVDIKYLPQMPDEQSRRYLFVSIDRVARWVFMHIYADESEDSSVDFLKRLETCRTHENRQDTHGKRQPVHKLIHE